MAHSRSHSLIPTFTRTIPRLTTRLSPSQAPLSSRLPSTPHQRLTAIKQHLSTSTSTMASIPSTMKAILVPENGDASILSYTTSQPVPTPSSSELLVKNHFAGVNFIDTYFRSGLYKAPSFPFIPGREAAGEVISAPEGSKIPVGARVVYMGGTTGSYAEYSTVPAQNAIVIPEGITDEVAVAVYLQGLTAWTFIREAGEVKPGQWALVHAAAGGVGTLLVQMLRSVGAKVIGTASSAEKLELVKKYGADYTINSTEEDVVARAKEITGGHGIDVIFDGIGKATFDMDLEMAAMKAHLISFGNASGAVPPVGLFSLTPKNIKLMRPVVNGYVSERADLEKYTGEIFDLIKSGKLEVKVHQVYDLEKSTQAHLDIESRKTTGKLIIKTN